MNRESLGETLRQLRGNKSLREIGKKTAISHTYLGILEKGCDPRTGNPLHPSPETLKILAKAYDYSYEKLLELSGYLDRPHPPEESEGETNGASRYQIELEKVLQRADVAFRGKGLKAEDRKRVLDMLTLLFQETYEKDESDDR